MRSEKEIRELKDELEKLTAFIGEFGTEEASDKDFIYSCNVFDALEWVLGEISTEAFLSDRYLNLKKLRLMAEEVEVRKPTIRNNEIRI